MQHLTTDVEGTEPSQKIQPALSLVVQGLSVPGPVKFTVQVNSKKFRLEGCNDGSRGKGKEKGFKAAKMCFL